jgi:hypothetical protein
MNVDFAAIPYNQIVWGILVIVGVILAFVVIRFFWKHILKYLFQGCLVIVGILGLLAVLHYYFKIF